MDISISDRAIKRIDEIRTEQNVPQDAFLKVGVVSGGCSGLTLTVKLNLKKTTGFLN